MRPTYEEHKNILFSTDPKPIQGVVLIHGKELRREVLIPSTQLCRKHYNQASWSLQQDRKIYIMSYSNDDLEETPTFEEFIPILNFVQFPKNIEKLNHKEIDIRNIFLAEKCHDVLTEEERAQRQNDWEKFIESHPELIEGIIQPELQQESASAASAASVEPVVQALECPVEPEIDSARPLDGAHDKPIGEAGVSFDGGS